MKRLGVAEDVARKVAGKFASLVEELREAAERRTTGSSICQGKNRPADTFSSTSQPDPKTWVSWVDRGTEIQAVAGFQGIDARS